MVVGWVALAAAASVGSAWEVKEPARGGCPRVYIYDLPEFWDYEVPLARLGSAPVEEIFGPSCGAEAPNEYGTDQYNVPLIVMWRIMRSGRCPRAMRPEDADLFLVPTFPAAVRHAGSFRSACEGNRQHDHLLEKLAYLDARTAHRHFFLVGKGHNSLNECDWWREPAGLVRKFMRFAYSSAYKHSSPRLPAGTGRTGYGPLTLDDEVTAKDISEDVGKDSARFPHLVSVPYPSSIHASRRALEAGDGAAPPPPWAADVPGRHNETLAVFVGKGHEDGTFARARAPLVAECGAAADCDVLNPGLMKSGFAFCGASQGAFPYTFCLEPGGDSPYRKGFYDAMLAGCIPVIFGAYNARVAPWFVPTDGVLRLPERPYLEGNYSALGALRAVPRATVRAMQAALHAGFTKLQYAVDDVPGDAVETLLSGALAWANRREARRRQRGS